MSEVSPAGYRAMMWWGLGALAAVMTPFVIVATATIFDALRPVTAVGF